METLNIKILGENCNKCEILFLRVHKIIAEYQLDAIVEKITDIQIVISHNIYTTPALVINNQVVSKGSLLSEKQIIENLNKFLADEHKITNNCHSTKKTNQYVLIFGLFISITIIAFLLLRNNDPDKVEEGIAQSDISKLTISDSVLLWYDYSKQNTNFELSFLEFGSTGCRECKMMDEVMEKVKTNFAIRINVVFYNVTSKDNKAIAKYFGIQMIPVQVLLDKKGKEVFRHIGFYSYNEIKNEFKKLNVN